MSRGRGGSLQACGRRLGAKAEILVGGGTVTEDLAAAGRGVVIGVLVVRNSAGDSLGVK